ncbi:dienelactone hydrolase family protein [Peredibacter starrii]|uniref:Dienelactone hydrolase family protein n=1 Tax=Peredibacter starrii TaxID=28202 RepID=A0AAX4HTF7_9BACT|nr:dienelactone hydrolase family protein [Peredibacter starrii]WPU66599.1 dienelactone hydrolase family protein [Peredibacter starrii]
MSYFDYTDGETIFEGYLATNGDNKTKRPCVLIGHAWSGPSEHFNIIAEALSKEGFIGFAFDVYGKGVRGKVDGDNSHLMNPLLEDRMLLRRRLLAALREAQKNPLVISDRIAVMGHCFGGLCALDLARANPEGLKGAISIHGLLHAPRSESNSKIDSSVLVLHGWEDPMVNPTSILDFSTEMTQAGADWQIHCYGHAMHAFTLQGADIPELGIKYNERAHKRAERASLDFLKEILF